MGKINENALKEIMNGILEIADKERRETDSYKDLFKSSENIEGLLREAEHRMVGVVLDTYTAYKDRYGEDNKILYRILLALPFITRGLTDDIRLKEGSACCVDKTYHLLSKHILENRATKSS